MNGWIIFALYAAAWLASGTVLSRRFLIGRERELIESYNTAERRRLYSPQEIRRETRLDRSDRGFAVFGGFGLSLFVPVLPVLVLAAFDLLTSRTRIFHTPREVAIEQAERDAAELAALRRLAAEYDLKLPETPR